VQPLLGKNKGEILQPQQNLHQALTAGNPILSDNNKIETRKQQ